MVENNDKVVVAKISNGNMVVGTSTIFKVLLSVVGVIFAAGIFYATVQSNIQSNTSSLVDIKTTVDKNSNRLSILETQIKRIEIMDNKIDRIMFALNVEYKPNKVKKNVSAE